MNRDRQGRDVQQKRMAIARMGHPVLRQISGKVTSPADAAIQVLIADMLTTVFHADGVGLAAPQLFAPHRIIILASRPNPRYPQAPEMPPTALINPELLWVSEDRETGWEGCLSIPGMRGLVPRNRRVGVRYLTRDGLEKESEYEGFPARVLQHEHDHLQGILFIDRLESLHDLVTEEEYLRRQREQDK